jgi:RimJ/RimL family protein N-acetyltransferase
MVTIREILPDDDARLLELCLNLDVETSFMMYEPGERQTTVAGQREMIEAVRSTPHSTIIVADAGHELAGYVAATGGEFNRIRHTAYVVAGVRQSYAGQGIGTRLFEALDAWARTTDLRRLELTVRADNAAAIRLYEKMWFQIEGTKRGSLLVAGDLIDELYMGRLLPPGTST